jgi:hypothetical protein
VTDTYVTKHARHRVHERTGLPKRAVARMVERALAEGLTPETANGDLRGYLLSQLHGHRETQGPTAANAEVRAFAGACFIFAGSTLVTCWRLPRELRAAA